MFNAKKRKAGAKDIPAWRKALQPEDGAASSASLPAVSAGAAAVRRVSKTAEAPKAVVAPIVAAAPAPPPSKSAPAEDDDDDDDVDLSAYNVAGDDDDADAGGASAAGEAAVRVNVSNLSPDTSGEMLTAFFAGCGLILGIESLDQHRALVRFLF